MKKMIRLLILVGAVLILQPDQTVAASTDTCSCAWEGDYWAYVWQNPYCGHSSGGTLTGAESAAHCSELCDYYARAFVDSNCGGYNCGDAPPPYFNPPTQYSYYYSWNFGGGGAITEGTFGGYCTY